MIKSVAILFLVVATGVACKSKKNTAKSSDNIAVADTVAKVAPTDSIRLSVSFISPGSGINGKALKQLESYTENFETANNLKITVYKVAWGREGEVDFCFKLSAIDKKKAEEFVVGVKNLLGTTDRVNIKENCSCRYWPQR